MESLAAVVGVGSSSLFHRVMISTAAGNFVCIYQENYRELAEVIAADLLAREGEAEPLSLLKDEEDEDEIIYASELSSAVVGSADEVLDNGFVIDEDSPEDIMDVFGDMSAEDEE